MPSACWERDFDAPVTAIWETLGDTARYNEAAGLPRQKITEQPRPDGSTRYLAETRMGWITLKWDDIPCNWVAGKWFRHERQFLTGPLTSMTATLHLEPTDAGCHGRYEIEAEPRGLLGHLLLKTGFRCRTICQPETRDTI